MSEPQNSSYSGATLGGLYNNVTGLPEYQRTPTIFKSGTGLTAASGAAWTPTAGKKFRLLGGLLTLSKDAAAAGTTFMTLQDAAGTYPLVSQISGGALVAPGRVTVCPFTIVGNGYLSAAANNVLNWGLSGAALTTGAFAFVVWGTEE